mmetsp:Transcript_53958/g.89562  ORF Transcript_53958/g.89562 Transcript_53958/m.89562 type:complete len:579 (+) Transcript_53958:100-1836(+)
MAAAVLLVLVLAAAVLLIAAVTRSIIPRHPAMANAEQAARPASLAIRTSTRKAVQQAVAAALGRDRDEGLVQVALRDAIRVASNPRVNKRLETPSEAPGRPVLSQPGFSQEPQHIELLRNKTGEAISQVLQPSQAVLSPQRKPQRRPPWAPAAMHGDVPPDTATFGKSGAESEARPRAIGASWQLALSVLGYTPAMQQLQRQAEGLKLFVYSPPASAAWSAVNLTARFPKCRTFQWSGDFEIIEQIRNSPHYTSEGDSADFFLVPFLSKCFFNFVAGYNTQAMEFALVQVLGFLSGQRWWQTQQHRHLFFFMSGVGASIIPSWKAQLGHSIFIVAEGDREVPYFRYRHDIVVPGKVSVRARNPSRVMKGNRRLLAMFRGSLVALLRDMRGKRVHKPNRLRKRLANQLKRVPGVVFSGHKSRDYVTEMDNSTFCIIPRGNTPWTRRFFDAALRGCIPTVLSNPISFPFERLFDYSQFTIKLPEEWATRLVRELHTVNESATRNLRTALLRATPAFMYRAGCAFELLLFELAARKHAFFDSWHEATRNSPIEFWNPAQGHFALPHTAKVGPSWGAAAVPH